MNMKSALKKIIIVSLVAVMASSCTPRKFSRGYVPDEKLVNAIRVEVDTKDSVKTMLGNPTMTPTFDDKNWYYYSKKSEQWSFLKEKVTEMDILAITFADDGYVSKIKHYTLADNKVIDPVSKKTVTHGKEESFIAELFGNIGRFGSAGGRPVTGN